MLPKGMVASKMVPMISKIIDGLKVLIGTNYLKKRFQPHSYHKLVNQEILPISQSTQTLTLSHLKSQRRMIHSLIGDSINLRWLIE